jgi:hypothetical protein
LRLPACLFVTAHFFILYLFFLFLFPFPFLPPFLTLPPKKRKSPSLHPAFVSHSYSLPLSFITLTPPPSSYYLRLFYIKQARAIPTLLTFNIYTQQRSSRLIPQELIDTSHVYQLRNSHQSNSDHKIDSQRTDAQETGNNLNFQKATCLSHKRTTDIPIINNPIGIFSS